MAIYSEKIVDGKVVKVEERTYRIDIQTPKTAKGPSEYSAAAYRERIETTDGVVTKLVRLPPLRVPINQSLIMVMSLIAGTVDTRAMDSTKAGEWPLDENGVLIPV